MKIWRSPILAIVLFLVVPTQAVSSETNQLSNNGFSCPQDYSNRVIQRTQRINREAGIRNFIITASPAEFEPLDLPSIQYHPISNQQPKQVFFTVLERQYNQNKITNIQTYHWLFLTKIKGGWQIIMMFSRFGNSRGTIPAPPIETTNGIIGQGIQLWLKDCRAGTVRL
jgi:hypothetical protein